MKVAVCDHALGSIGMSWRGGGKLSVDFCKFHHVLAGIKGKSKKYYSRFSFFVLFISLCALLVVALNSETVSYFTRKEVLEDLTHRCFL